MKRFIFCLLFSGLIFSVNSQVSNSEKLQGLENNSASAGSPLTATTTSSTRLFSDVNDLTSVIVVIPKGSMVEVIDSDSTYLHIYFEDNEGYIYSRHASIDKKPEAQVKQVNSNIDNQNKQSANQQEPQQMSRFAYLESKYGTSMAARINAGKIWKGMNAEMVKDSWGRPDKITREISGNTVQEEWIYPTTWLYLENNTLMGWGPIKK
jgi:hypothetical protein